ncbi:MAG: beta-galactosidase [Defluviitaleaceae bacterium]|nr:beta-galactosidase [Defluviitaleaceae bacterium]
MNKYEKESRLLHGGDYNPDQWLKHPNILADDITLMQKAHINAVSVGIFAWSALEPIEGQFNFTWLDKIMDDMAKISVNVLLATPTGARPAWMSQKYPEVLRTNARREKMLHGGRHNHCFTSPVYREKTAIINEKLAERYKDHPALFMWHISNEYNGECHCPLCQQAFRIWLQNKYRDITTLNDTYWSTFWSHTYNDFSQIESPSPIGETGIHALNLDWRRFVSHQTIDFYKNEISPLRKLTPHVPVTTNFMGRFPGPHPFDGLDYAKFAKEVDIISWDSYPAWHNDYETTEFLASKLAFLNDYFRTLKDKPFLILESTPSLVNWHPINRAKRPGMHMLSSMACLAHGADSIMYFQFRKSRGSSEKLHGAVVDHDNSAENRVFKDVADVGQALERLKNIKGAATPAKVAVLFDLENHWALADAQGFTNNDKKYPRDVHAHYKAFWDKSIAVDVVTKDKDLTKYQLVVAPMLYVMDAKLIADLAAYVHQGGRLVSTYMMATADENDLVYPGTPQALRDVFGINILETDTLYPSHRNGFALGGKEYTTMDYCAVIETCGADVLAAYNQDFYKDTPALTKNTHGKGCAWFLAARTNADFLTDFYAPIIAELGLTIPPITSPPGVSVQMRENNSGKYFFVLNYTEEQQVITLAHPMEDMLTGQTIPQGKSVMNPYETRILM